MQEGCDEDTITFSTAYNQGDTLLNSWVLYLGDGNSTTATTDSTPTLILMILVM